MKTDTIHLTEIDDFIKLCEAQNQLAYHLQKYKEHIEARLAELKIIEQKALKVQQLRAKFRQVYPDLKNRMNEDVIKKLNNILQAKHIKL